MLLECVAISIKYAAGAVILSMLRMKPQPVFRGSTISTLDTGSGQEIPAVSHGIGV